MRWSLLLLLATEPALAGGYFYADSGVVPVGRGGAWFATADTGFASRYNPAGLTRIDGQEVNLGVSAVNQGVRFARRNEDGSFEPEVRNEGGVFTIPQLTWAGRIHEDWAVAFGLTTAYAPDYRFPADGPQRYVLIDSIVLQGAIGPSIAWRPHDRVRLGVTPQAQFLRVGQTLAVTTNGTTDPRSDIGVDVITQDLFSPSANAGVIVEPVDALAIAVAVQLPASFDASGSMTVDFTGNGLEPYLDDPVLTDDAVSLQIQLPLEVRTGVAVFPTEEVEIELAAVWQQWSSLDAITLRDIDLSVDPGLGEPLEVDDTFDLPAGFRDTVSLRLGGSAEVNDWLAVRAGGFYETGSLQPRRVSVSLYDPAKWSLSGGATGTIAEGRLRADVSAAYIRFPSLSIRNSLVTQTNVQGGDEAVVGNGDYASDGFVVAGALTFAFGKRFDD